LSALSQKTYKVLKVYSEISILSTALVFGGINAKNDKNSTDTPYRLTLFQTAGEAEKADSPQQCIIGHAARAELARTQQKVERRRQREALQQPAVMLNNMSCVYTRSFTWTPRQTAQHNARIIFPCKCFDSRQHTGVLRAASHTYMQPLRGRPLHAPINYTKSHFL